MTCFRSAVAAGAAGMSILLLAPPPAAAQQQQAQKEETEVTYTPPLRGAPQRRIGGSSRGIGGPLPAVFVLAPDHVGLTTVEQPALYWFISGPTRVRVELTLVDAKQIAPLVEMPVAAATSAGIQRLRLTDIKVSLRPEAEYQWTVSLVPDDRQRSNDVISSGVIRRVAPPAGLAERLAGVPRDARPRLLAAAGLWYDALAELSLQIEEDPGNRALREQRARLLEQAGLRDVAAFDRQSK